MNGVALLRLGQGQAVLIEQSAMAHAGLLAPNRRVSEHVVAVQKEEKDEPAHEEDYAADEKGRS